MGLHFTPHDGHLGPKPVRAERSFARFKIGILENWNFGKLEFWKLPLGEGGVEAE